MDLTKLITVITLAVDLFKRFGQLIKIARSERFRDEKASEIEPGQEP